VTRGVEPLVLVIEDEPQMRRFLRTSLRSQGYQVIEAATGREGLRHAAGYNPDLILLDLGLPDGDGLAVAKVLRSQRQTPIIVLSARGRDEDKVAALDLGADDYLTKPFGLGELLARMRVARRHAAPTSSPSPLIEAGPIRLDLEKRHVSRDGAEVHLTPTEYRLLAVLGQHAGKVLTHRQLLEEVWGPTYAGQTHYLRVYMAQLRNKLEVDPAKPEWLITEPAVGYRLRG
jgi:two-component system KDP operon response regulator KdpE